MLMNEHTHALIAVSLWEQLEKADIPENSVRDIFTCCIRRYGFERGQRMAQRAVRDGLPLNHETYRNYTELSFTRGDGVIPSVSEITEVSPDFVMILKNCPWHDTFAAKGRTDIGAVYCGLIDEAIAAGFSPDLAFVCEQNLNEAPCCRHVVKHPGYEELPPLSVCQDGIRSFEYHCAHLYHSSAAVLKSILGERGEEIADKVLAAVEERCGPAAAGTIRSYRDRDFSDCGSR